MTTRQFIAMIAEAETGGLWDDFLRLTAIGDNGLAGGRYQQHWSWRKDYWPKWAWELLAVIDRIALESFVKKFPGSTARALADRYNLGHAAPDPAYDQRCLAGLKTLGIDQAEFGDPVSDQS